MFNNFSPENRAVYEIISKNVVQPGRPQMPIYKVRHKSINTPLSHERLVGGLQNGGRGTHVTHFVQLYPNHYILRARCVRHAARGMKGCQPTYASQGC